MRHFAVRFIVRPLLYSVLWLLEYLPLFLSVLVCSLLLLYGHFQYKQYAHTPDWVVAVQSFFIGSGFGFIAFQLTLLMDAVALGLLRLVGRLVERRQRELV